MPQSLSSICIHLVFSTKDRVAFLDDPIRHDLYAYMATLIRNDGCACDRIGGTADHVHIALRLSRSTCVAGLVKELKASSSAWLKRTDSSLKSFSWQRGYAALSFASNSLVHICRYIDNQEAHHKNSSFIEEYRALLDECGIEYNEQYLFD